MIKVDPNNRAARRRAALQRKDEILTRREDEMKERIHSLEGQLVKAATMIGELRDQLADRGLALEAAEEECASLNGKLILAKAEAEGAGSMMLSVQQDCINERLRADAAEYKAKRWEDVAKNMVSWEKLWAEQVDRTEAAGKRITELEAVLERIAKESLDYQYVARAALEAKP